jgi:hypothetical protein
MPPQDWSKVIAASVVPVVIISACGLLCLAFYNRLAAVVSRLRTFHRERLHEHESAARRRAAGEPGASDERRHELLLTMLGEQTARVTRRARLIRDALLCLLATIGCLTGCSLSIGVGVFWPAANYAAVALFMVGMVLLLLAVALAIAEMRRALDPVELESQFVTSLAGEPGDEANPAARG